jgi:hypothetical protein
MDAASRDIVHAHSFCGDLPKKFEQLAAALLGDAAHDPALRGEAAGHEGGAAAAHAAWRRRRQLLVAWHRLVHAEATQAELNGRRAEPRAAPPVPAPFAAEGPAIVAEARADADPSRVHPPAAPSVACPPRPRATPRGALTGRRPQTGAARRG